MFLKSNCYGNVGCRDECRRHHLYGSQLHREPGYIPRHQDPRRTVGLQRRRRVSAYGCSVGRERASSNWLDTSSGCQRRVHRVRPVGGLLQFHLQSAELAGDAQPGCNCHHNLPGGQRSFGQGFGRQRQSYCHHRLSLDYRGRPQLLRQPQLHNELNYRNTRLPSSDDGRDRHICSSNVRGEFPH